jgi:asparagine synthase (glutamine-hydrolysing)
VSGHGIKVALSGLGGDELFGGYPSFRNIPRLAWLGSLPPGLARAIVKLSPSAVRQKLANLVVFTPAQLAIARRRFFDDAALCAAGLEPCRAVRVDVPRHLDQFAQISLAEIGGYMNPMLLRDSDQMSMAASIELRVPFLDLDLAHCVLRLPEACKRGAGIKPLLVESCADLLPRNVYDRPKQGFALPMDTWLRGPLRDYCREGLDRLEGFIDAGFVRDVDKGFTAGGTHWTRLWQLAVLGHYLGRA